MSFWDITAACPLEVPVMDLSVQHLKSTPDLLFALIFHKNAKEQNIKLVSQLSNYFQVSENEGLY